MNATKTTMIASLIVLLLAMASTASAAYYYTGEYFEKTFGDAKAAKAPAELKHDVMMYTDSDVFHNEFGISKLKDGSLARPLVGKPGEVPAAVETALEPPAGEAPGDEALVEVAAGNAPQETAAGTVYLANGTGITLDNETEVVAVPIIPAEPAAGEPDIIAAGDEAGSLVVDEKSGEAAGEGLIAEGPGLKTEDPGLKTEDPGLKTEDSIAPTPAVVSGDGTPVQIAIISILIVVIVAMLAVLLLREDKGGKGSGTKAGKDGKDDKKGDWEEGSFFKEAKEKKAAREPKAVEIRAIESNSKAPQKKEIKPFLLKIKEEA